MSDLPPCPQCKSNYSYADRDLFICPECAHEWSAQADTSNINQSKIVQDANGNTLEDGDSVTVIKDLKIKGTFVTLKIGTLIKNIRLTANPNEIECNIPKVKGLY